MHNKKLFAPALTAFLLWPVGSAQAQSGGVQLAEDTQLEEIVVTARKREEGLQDTPIAVSAMSGTDLQEAGYTNLSNLSLSVPGLSLENGSGSGGAAAPRIRGIGQSDTKETLEQGVAIYIDGVYQGRPDGALLDLVDIQSIQVLRGPQGTLFGKNSTGGAMVITTNRPTDTWEGDLLLRVGNLDERDAQLTVNAPITDTLFSRFSFSSTRRDGYSKQKDPNTLQTIDYWDDEDRLYAYGQLRWLASDTVTVDLTANWGKQREKGRGNNCVYALDDNPALATDLFGAFGGPALPSIVGLLANLSYEQGCELSEALGDESFTSSIEGVYENDVAGLSTTVTWEIGPTGVFDDLSFKSITGWRKVDTRQNNDVDGTHLPMVDRTRPEPRESDQYSQELQLNFSALDARLNGVAGAFLYHERTNNALVENRIGPYLLDEGFISLLLGVPVGTYDTYWYTNRAEIAATSDDMFALYTQLDFAVNDIITITGGLRYNWEKKELAVKYLENTNLPQYATLSATQCMPELSGGDCSTPPQVTPKDIADGIPLGALFPSLPSGFTAGDLLPSGTIFFTPQGSGENIRQVIQPLAYVGRASEQAIFRSWTPMLSIQADAPGSVLDALHLDSGMGYFTYSRGFKAGGLVAEGILQLGPYDPEKVDNYEVGFKLQALDNRLRLNAAAFYMDYQDIQVTEATGNPTDPVDVRIQQSNAGTAKISGVELETVWMPISRWMIMLNATYTDASYTNFDYEFVAGNFSTVSFDRADYGETFPNVARWTAFLGTQYTFVTDWGMITPRIDASYHSGRSGHFDYLSSIFNHWYIEEQTILNARVTWDLPDGQTQLTAWVNNIEDVQYRNGGNPIPEITGGGTYSMAPPRTYGIDFRYRF